MTARIASSLGQVLLPLSHPQQGSWKSLFMNTVLVL